MNETIEKLNSQVKCTLAPSKIHGIGVFALRDIKKGEKLHCISLVRKSYELDEDGLSRLLPEVRKIILQRWPLARLGNRFVCPNDDARLISFMNHAEDPNYDLYSDLAFRDIKKGEEITEHYGEFKEDSLAL